MASKADRLVDITMVRHTATDKAILASDDGDSDNAVWLPLSVCEVQKIKEDMVEITMPEWLAKEKGLI